MSKCSYSLYFVWPLRLFFFALSLKLHSRPHPHTPTPKHMYLSGSYAEPLLQNPNFIFSFSRWGDGLMYSVHAHNLHTDIYRVSGSEDFSLQKRHLTILVELRRKALQGVSKAAYKLFENNNVREALKEANSLLVPGLAALARSPCEGDNEVLAAVREEWCQYLTHPGLSEGALGYMSRISVKLIWTRLSLSECN